MQRLLAYTSLTLLLAAPTAVGAEPAASFDAAIRPALETFCLRCHSEKKQEGEFRLDNLSRDFADQATAEHWSEVLFRLNAGEMPPKDQPQPSPEQLGPVVDWIAARLHEGEAARMARRGPLAHYRLSRDEYGYTILDLLGVYFDASLPGALNEDPRWHGFDRLGSKLSLSPSHVERYVRAADTIIARAFPEQPIATQTNRRAAEAPQRWLLWPGRGQYALQAPTPGLYRVRIQLSGLASFKGRAPHLALWHQGLKRSVVGRDVLAAENQPATVEFETFLPEGHFDILNEAPGMLSDQHTVSNTDATIVSTTALRPARPASYKLFDEQGRSIFPLLLVDWIECTGPIVTDADRQKREGIYPTQAGDLAEARACLARFARRAWRRPVTDAEVDRYVQLVQNELAAGEPFRSAYLAAMVGVLTSKNFYYLEEGSATERRERVNDWELASRLSYFLWSSMPDEELMAAAQSGSLHTSEGLRGQLARMLADAKISRFTETFPRQWLQLHRVGMFPPDATLYADYDKWLEQSMVLESSAYFAEMFSQNLPLREFLNSDWTMLNPRLALHYGLPQPTETGMRRVTLRPEDHRGGLLTQAAVLTLTSDGTRHRPVHRGVWLSEAIFAKTPPSPPPNVEPLAPTPSDKPKATVRMQLEAHATHAICASCHRNIDPLGIAFDNYDAIGQWRVEERVPGGQGGNPPVNASGALPDGRAFAGPEQFKQLLAQDEQRFAQAFVEQLATFGLRRVMTIDDQRAIQAIVETSAASQYRLRTLIENFVTSELFQKR